MRIAVTIIASIALCLFALCEVGFPYPVAWWLYLAVLILFALGILRRTSLRRQPERVWILAVLSAAIAGLYFVPWSSRKPFLRDLYSIRPGMTESQARQIMGRYMEGTGWPAVYGNASNAPGSLVDAGSGATYATDVTPSGEMAVRDFIVYRHSTDGAYDSDWGIISLSNGVVLGVSFSAD